MEEKNVLEIRSLVKNYPGVKALKGVSLSFLPGEIHGLMGENGAGKSTLIKILAGVVKADAGETVVRGRPVEIRSGREASRAGLCFIHQELNLVNYFNVMENIFLGHAYPRRIGPLVNWNALKKKTEAILDSLQVTLPFNVPVSYLSAVDRAMIAIARSFAESGNIYFMDEPATSLTDIEKEKLFRVIHNLKNQGKTVIYVSHNLDDVLRITDRISVMRDGEAVGTWPTREMNRDSLIAAMIGRNLGSAFPQGRSEKGPPVFQMEDAKNEKVGNLNFEVKAGEILGIGGLVGSGRSELLDMIYGVSPLKSGKMLLDGKVYSPGSPREAIKHRVALVPEERRKQGLVLSRSIYENISLMSLTAFSSGGFLRHGRIRRESEAAGKKVRLKTGAYSNPTGTLSGGNQQKVVFARTVLQSPLLLLLDEPSKGVDVGARFEIYTIIRKLADAGAAVIVVSSDFNEILGLADRILFLKEGRQTFIRENAGMDQETYLNCCYGRNSI